MRTRNYFLAAALLTAFSGTAMAQAAAPPPAPTPGLPPTNDLGFTRSHWVVSGSVGSNLGSSDSNLSVDHRESWEFGGQTAYLWRGVVGAEFLASFTPSYGIDTNLNFDNPNVTSYMGNVIGALPIGANGQFQPYVSGGYGGLDMSIANITIGDTTVKRNQSGWGSNVGAGLMAFVGRSRFGIRADARYYNSSTKRILTGDLADEVTRTLLSDLTFWRTNIGLAYQW